MIVIEHRPGALYVSVAGQFSLSDLREFEDNLRYEMAFHGRPAMLLDLTQMIDYTLDVAWEEWRFTLEHRHDFGRIAIVTEDRFVQWAAWINRLFVDSEVEVFSSARNAEVWLSVVS